VFEMNNCKNAPTNLTMPIYLSTCNNFRATEWIVIKSDIKEFYYFLFTLRVHFQICLTLKTSNSYSTKTEQLAELTIYKHGIEICRAGNDISYIHSNFYLR